jgi:hypothetical protein
MNQKILIFFFFQSLLCMSYAQYGFIEGTVVDTMYKKPVSDGTVVISDLNIGTMIDSLGRFKIKLPIGKHKVDMRRPGLSTIKTNVSIYADSTTVIEIGTTDSCLFSNSSKANKVCPKCHKSNRAIPIIYGLPIGEKDTSSFFYAGCKVTGCDPYWYCKRDKIRF